MTRRAIQPAFSLSAARLLVDVFSTRRRLRWLLFYLAVGFGLQAFPVRASTNLSNWVCPGPGGRLLQQPDALGNRILDHSSVGYQGGGVPLPEVPVKVTISPVAGDDTANIQAAINTVKALPLDCDRAFAAPCCLMPANINLPMQLPSTPAGLSCAVSAVKPTAPFCGLRRPMPTRSSA